MRHDPRARFSLKEVADFLGKIISDLPADWDPERIRLALILERPIAGFAAEGWERPVGTEREVGRILAGLLREHHEAGKVAAALDKAFLAKKGLLSAPGGCFLGRGD